MSKSHRNISKLVLVSCLVGSIGLNPVFANDSEIKLRGSVNDAIPIVQLKGGVAIDKRNQKISLSLRDSDVKQVLRMLADKAGVNIIFHNSVDGKVTLDLVNTSLNKAFEYVMTLNGLSYWLDGRTLVVASKGSAAGLGINKSQIKAIKIKYLDSAAVAEFLNNNIFSLNRPDISDSGVVITNPATNEVIIFGNENDIALAQKVVSYLDVKPSLKTFTINYANVGEIANKICNTVFTGKGGNGTNTTQTTSTNTRSSSGSDQDQGSSIYCSSVATSSTNGVVSSVSTSNSSPSPEGASSSTTTTSGGSFNGINSTLKSLNSTGYWVSADPTLSQVTVFGATEQQMRLAEDVVKQFDKKQPQVYIEISIIELSQSGSKALSGATTVGSSYGTFGYRGKASKVEFANKKLSTLPGLAGEGKILSNYSTYGTNSHIVQTLQALVEQRKGRVLANPRIIATNNKESTIDISSDFVQKRTTQTVAIGDSSQTTDNYEIGSYGIKLKILPKISPNGYVTIDLAPSYTSQKEQVKDGDDIIATLLNRRDLDLKDVRIKDGETLILGGLIQEEDSNSVSKVPILGDLPVVGALFRDSSTDKSRSELILMITPKVLKEEDTVTAI